MKVAFITYSMAPYRTKQFEEIVKINHFDLSVYYIGRSVKTRDWKVENSKLFKEYHLTGYFKLGNHYLLYKDVKRVVLENDIFLLGGYNSTAMFIFLFYIKKYHKKAIFVMDGISPKKLAESSSIKFLVKSKFIRRMDGYFVNGQVSRKYLIKNFDVNPDTIFNQYLTVDVDRINALTAQNIKREINKKFLILYSGRILPRKRVSDFLKAANLTGIKNNISILIVGSGSEKSNIQQLGESLNLDISFIPFIKNQDDLFKTYGRADCLVLPSDDDPWGLVVNEAEAAHLPVIVSDACGCALDLVKSGINGYTYESKNVNELSKKIIQVYNAVENGTNMGAESFKIISKWKFSDSAQSFKSLIEKLGS